MAGAPTRRRLGAWLWFAIVLSVIWFVGFTEYLTDGPRRRAYDAYQVAFNSCFAATGSFGGELLKCLAPAEDTLEQTIKTLDFIFPFIVGLNLWLVMLVWFIVWGVFKIYTTSFRP
jgi:hypothetical protein